MRPTSVHLNFPRIGFKSCFRLGLNLPKVPWARSLLQGWLHVYDPLARARRSPYFGSNKHKFHQKEKHCARLVLAPLLILCLRLPSHYYHHSLLLLQALFELLSKRTEYNIVLPVATFKIKPLLRNKFVPRRKVPQGHKRRFKQFQSVRKG